jgi:hypothetical protein
MCVQATNDWEFRHLLLRLDVFLFGMKCHRHLLWHPMKPWEPITALFMRHFCMALTRNCVVHAVRYASLLDIIHLRLNLTNESAQTQSKIRKTHISYFRLAPILMMDSS